MAKFKLVKNDIYPAVSQVDARTGDSPWASVVKQLFEQKCF